MPINPQIPLSVQPPQVPGPLEYVQQIQRAQALRDERAAIQEERAARTDERQAAADELARKRARQAQIDEAYRNSISVGEDGRISVNTDSLVAGLPPSAIPGTLKELNLDEESVNRIAKAKLDLAKSTRDHLGSVAMTVRASGYDPQLFGIHVRGARDLGALEADAADRLLGLDDPEQIRSVVDSYIQQAGIDTERGVVVAPGAQIRDPRTGRLIAEGPPPREAPVQSVQVSVNGRPAMATFNPSSGRYLVGGRDVTDQVTPIPPREPAGPAPVVVQTPTGPQILDKDTGIARPITGPGGEPIGRIPTAEQTNLAAQYGRARPVLDAVSELSAKINTGQGAVAKITGTVERAKAQANLNDDVAEYQSLIAGFTPMVARALGHTGVLTEQDVASVRSVFPQPGDSKALRDRKIARITNLMGAIEGTAAGTAPPRDGGGGGDPLGIR